VTLATLISLIQPIAESTYGTAGVDGLTGKKLQLGVSFTTFWKEWGTADLDYNEVIGFNLDEVYLVGERASPRDFSVLIFQPRSGGRVRVIQVDFPNNARDRQRLFEYVQHAIAYQREKWLSTESIEKQKNFVLTCVRDQATAAAATPGGVTNTHIQCPHPELCREKQQCIVGVRVESIHAERVARGDR